MSSYNLSFIFKINILLQEFVIKKHVIMEVLFFTVIYCTNGIQLAFPDLELKPV